MLAIRVTSILFLLLLSACSRQHQTSQQKILTSPVEVKKVAWVEAQLQAQLAQWQGTRYRYGGMAKKGIDCSGFVLRTFRDRFAINLPRTTKEQMTLGSPVLPHQLTAGDLVFFKIKSSKSRLHVGIYHGKNKFIHASTKQGVMRSSLKSAYWRKHYWQARRLAVKYDF